MLSRAQLIFLPLLVLLPLSMGAAQAQTGRWTRAGNASGAGFAGIPSLRIQPHVAWSQRLSGELESEPLVWDRNALLTLKDRAGRRSLVWMDLVSGRRLASQTLVSTSGLVPSIFGERVAVRVDGRRVDLLRLNGARFQLLRSFGGDAPVSAPLLSRGVLFLRVGDELRGYSLERNEAVWTLAGEGKFRGTPSLSGGVLFALRYDKTGRAALELIDPRNGESLGSIACGDHGGVIPAQDAKLKLAVLDEDVFVHFPLPVRGSGEETFRTARVALTSTSAGPRLAPNGDVHLYKLMDTPIELSGGWLGLAEFEGAPFQWMAGSSGAPTNSAVVRGVVLSSATTHPELLEAPAAAAVGGEVALIGDVAADTSTWKILWRLPATPTLRPVPCEPTQGQAGWLVATAKNQLSLLWAPTHTGSTAESSARQQVLDLQQREADSLAQLAQRALQSGDVNLVSRLIRAATERGARTTGNTGRALALAQDGLARLLAAGAQRSSPRRAKAFAAEEEQILKRLGDELARAALGAGDAALRRALLGALLARDPQHPAAAQAARAMLPEGAPLGPHFDASSWLTFLNVTATHPVTFERPQANPKAGAVPERLAEEAQAWRPDLVAYRSERLAVITPPGHPGAVARALAVGELVSDVLEELLQTRKTPNQEPLILLLYESEAEYRAQSARDSSAPEVTRGWTVGHFDPRDNLSRMFVPPGDIDNQRLLGTFAHELTHHWLATRSPFAAVARRARGERDRSGFWLVEGMANLVGELSFDPAASTWSANNPRADSLDSLANTEQKDRIDWGRLLSLSKNGFDELSFERVLLVPLTWQLGAASQRSDLNLFYDQAGALAHYLFAADDGRHAPILFEALSAYYTGAAPVDVAGRMGTDAATLGEWVSDYASRTVHAR